MGVIHPWMIAAWAAIALVVAVVGGRRHRRQRRSADQALVAHVGRLTQLPRWQRAARRYRRLIGATLVAASAVILGAGALSARVVHTTVTRPEFHSRDIMLCLDVSGSMAEVDAKIVGIFAQLTRGFRGERVGLTLFDSSSVNVIPLTDDYAYIATQLRAAKRSFGSSFDPGTVSIYEGTNLGSGSSLIGDGLASCVDRFDHPNARRSRSIVLATDNQVSGAQLVTLPQAAAFARKRKVRVYGLNPNDYSSDTYASEEAESFRAAALATDGDYWSIDSDRAVAGILRQIKAQDSARFRAAPRRVTTDTPRALGLAVLAGVVLLLGALWRLRA